MSFRRWIALPFMVVFTAVALVFSLYRLYQSAHLTSTGIHAAGTIVDRRLVRDNESDYYLPIVEFKTTEGVTRRFTSQRGWKGNVGERVRVLYDRQSDLAEIDSFKTMWGGQIGTLIAVILLIGLPTAYIAWTSKPDQSG